MPGPGAGFKIESQGQKRLEQPLFCLPTSGKNGAVLYTFDGDSTMDRFGWSVSGAGDVNSDGFADLLVGAVWGAHGAGSAHVFSGNDGRVLYTFAGDTVGDEFGSSVSAAGDVNGDGFADLVAGAPKDDNNGTSSGSARVLLSRRFDPGRVEIYGAPCFDSSGNVARIGVEPHAPRLGETTSYILHYGAASPAILAIGPKEHFNIPLGSCRALIFPAVFLGGSLNPPVLRMSFPSPMKTKLIGLGLTMQWALEDPNNKHILTSDAVELRLGAPFPK